MNAIRIVCAIALSVSSLLQAEDFSLSRNGFGPITVHTQLTSEGKGERLIATATNDSGAPIPYVKFCVTAAIKGCVFTMWNTETWEPGTQLNWNITSARHLPNLAHEVKIEVLNLLPVSAPPVPERKAAGSAPVPPKLAARSDQTAVPSQTPLDDLTVQKLAKAGLGDDVILRMIERQPGVYSHTPDALIALKQAGVSDRVIAAILEKNDVPSSPVTPQPTEVGRNATSEPPIPKDKPTPIPPGVTLCLQPMPGSFDDFLIGEMQKQKVPVTIIATVPNVDDAGKPGACDPNKSSYTMTGNVLPEGKSFSARSVFGLRLHLRDEIQAAVKLVRNSDNAVVWAGDSDRGEVKTVAEHIVNQMLKQRPVWILSPITR